MMIFGLRMESKMNTVGRGKVHYGTGENGGRDRQEVGKHYRKKW